MKRFLLTAAVAVLGLALGAVSPTQAAGHSGGHFSHGAMSGHREFGHRFKASERFDYDRHGFRSFSWSHRRWDDYYHRYFYWAPSYGWCFYEPSYSCYVPFSYYHEVYPEAPHEVTLASPPPSVVQQQTTVVVTPTPGVSEPPPPPAPTVAPAPTAVQKTKVGAGAP